MAAPKSSATRTLGQRVRDARLRLGLSQEDIAELAEMHWTNWGKVERGVANPNFMTLVRMAAALEIDPAELVRGIGRDDLPAHRHQLTASELLRERERRAKP